MPPPRPSPRERRLRALDRRGTNVPDLTVPEPGEDLEPTLGEVYRAVVRIEGQLRRFISEDVYLSDQHNLTEALAGLASQLSAGEARFTDLSKRMRALEVWRGWITGAGAAIFAALGFTIGAVTAYFTGWPLKR